MSNLHRTLAAPNRCELKAKLLVRKQDSRFSDKWNMELEILDIKNISGPNFAHVGDMVKGFAFDSTPNFVAQRLDSGSIIMAEAEFLGDERGGIFQLHRIILSN